MIPVVAFKTVHLNQQLVQGLFALVIPAAQTSTTMTPDSVNFIDEDDARRVLLGILEHVADASRTDADEHLDKIRTRDAEKNGTFASPAIALASRVLPVPGLPTISTPLGMRPPSFWNLEGSRRKSTNS